MFNLSLIGLISWLLVIFRANLISGEIYYSLNNWWILYIPFTIFFLAWIITPYTVKKRAGTANIINHNLIIYFYYKTLKTSIIIFGIISIITIYIVNKIGISIFNAQELRDAYFTSDTLTSLGSQYFIWATWALTGTLYFLFIISSAIDVIRRKPLSNLTKLNIFSFFIWSLASGSRGDLFNIILLYIGAWLSIFKPSVHLKSKRVLYYTFTALIVFTAPLSIQQINRASSNDAFNEGDSVVTKYFIGPSFALDQLIQTGIIDEIIKSMDRFGISLYGFDTLFVSGFMRGILGSEINSALSLTSYIFHNGVYIGNNIVMNAHYTAGSKFYIELGVIGYAINYALIALVSILVDRYKNIKNNFFLYPVLYSTMFLQISLSTREFILDSPQYLITLILLSITAFKLQLFSSQSK